MAQPQEGWQIGHMIGMQMTNADQRKVAQLRARLSKPQIGAAAHVDEHSGLAVDPQQITRRRPILVEARTGGSQNLQGRRPGCAALRRGARRSGENEHAAHHEQPRERDHESPVIAGPRRI